MRFFLLGMFFVACTVGATALVVVLAVPGIPSLFGVPSGESVGGWQALASVGVAIPLVFGALYLSGLVWLFCACHLFTRDEVERFARVGPSSGLEIWMLERFSR